jgi:uncharacterized repeat protein (TIGR04138 family)
VAEQAIQDRVMARIRERETRFHEHAYMFVLAALEFRQSTLPHRRHLAGAELAASCRDLALERFGLMSKDVLEYWGIRSTQDLGDVVFTLVDLGLLICQPSDCREEYHGVYEFGQAFEREYPWSGVVQA